MGIGRREFLRFFGAGLVSLVAKSANAIAILEDYYINRKLGIAFCKPLGWSFGDIAEMGAISDGQIFDLDDQELVHRLIQQAGLPILVISQEPLSADSTTFTPGVVVYLERMDEAVADGDSRLLSGDDELSRTQAYVFMLITKDLVGCSALLKEFQLLSAPVSLKVSGCEAASYAASYVFEHVNFIFSPRVRVRTLYVYQNPALYVIRMYDSPYVGGSNIFDYDRFVQTVKMV